MTHHPRVFIQGEEHPSATDVLPDHRQVADVLVVCGQGVYANGTYYGEFHDRDVYFEHALSFPGIASRFNYNVVVTSGGFTQPRAPWLTEAESFLRILRDANATVPNVPVILDEAALDSAENLLLGLMTARLALGTTPIRRVGIWAAWQFKKWRFNRNAEALGIVERTYFHGFSPAGATNVQVPPDDSRQRTFTEYRDDVTEYRLLREPDKEAKRQKRWQNNRFDSSRDSSISGLPQGNLSHWSRYMREDSIPAVRYDGKNCSDYRNRLAMFHRFGRTLKAIEALAEGKGPKDSGLAEAFADEVIKP